MAECTYSGICTELRFKFVHQLFENNKPTPTTFDFVTAEGSEFSVKWTVTYVIDFKALEQPHNTWDLTYVEINSKGNLSDGDVAEVKILVDEYECLSANFDSPTKWFDFADVKDLVVKASNESKIFVEVKVYHQNGSIGKMVEDYSEFWENKDLCDVTFIIDGEELPAHKQILAARNAVFAKMFKSDMKEKKDGRVEIKDFEYEIFTLFLKYIYLGSVDSEDLQEWLKLIVVADKYSMPSLVSLCETYLASNLTKDNVADVFVVADLVSADVLKSKCKICMYEKRHKIVNTSGYKSLVDSKRADLISEIHCDILERLKLLEPESSRELSDEEELDEE